MNRVITAIQYIAAVIAFLVVFGIATLWGMVMWGVGIHTSPLDALLIVAVWATLDLMVGVGPDASTTKALSVPGALS
jgi:hypothetical protein